jgi:putative restriction endonuclease
VFLRLKQPHNAIAGYGFFAHFSVLSLEKAWDFFAWRNGDETFLSFLDRIGGYRRLNLRDEYATRDPLGCTILRDLVFWPQARWMPWREPQGWAPNIVRGKTEADLVNVSRLLSEVADEHSEPPEDLVASFELVEVDGRRIVELLAVERPGQGSFRARLLDAYGRRCAITGERTEPVLDAAHIQPYLGPRSNHVQNGLLLTKEFHTLFDCGYVTVTPETHIVRVSPRLNRDYSNGKRYYAYDDKPLAHLPPDPGSLPSNAALAWHGEHRFRP